LCNCNVLELYCSETGGPCPETSESYETETLLKLFEADEELLRLSRLTLEPELLGPPAGSPRRLQHDQVREAAEAAAEEVESPGRKDAAAGVDARFAKQQAALEAKQARKAAAKKKKKKGKEAAHGAAPGGFEVTVAAAGPLGLVFEGVDDWEDRRRLGGSMLLKEVKPAGSAAAFPRIVPGLLLRRVESASAAEVPRDGGQWTIDASLID
jgi:hypothetical protein